jgi:hypothetical protein
LDLEQHSALLLLPQFTKRFATFKGSLGIDGRKPLPPRLALRGQTCITIAITFAGIELLVDYGRNRRLGEAMSRLRNDLVADRTQGSP